MTESPGARPREYALTGLMHCGVCQRRMQGSWNNGKPHYRCVSPEQYALANRIDHPRSLYVREELVLPPLDSWLTTAFDPPHLTRTLRAMEQSQDLDDGDLAAAEQARRIIAEADGKLARYRAALESGTDPVLISTWTAEVTAAKAQAQAGLRALGGRDKAAVHRRLGLRLTYQPEPKLLIAKARPSAIMYETECPRGVNNQDPIPASRVCLRVQPRAIISRQPSAPWPGGQCQRG